MGKTYKVRVYGGDWEPISQSIPLTYADCHYGGTRPYFRCNDIVNGRHCTRRVGKAIYDLISLRLAEIQIRAAILNGFTALGIHHTVAVGYITNTEGF